ncbi:hypothetical protein AS149_32145 [Burkholderia cenocepacia]|nr:hypothetical protein AS149_32145 [Burkholderia cenocepacia]
MFWLLACVATSIALQLNAQRSAVERLLKERFETTGRRAALEIENQLAQAQVITRSLADSLTEDDLNHPDKLQQDMAKLPLVDARVLRTLSVMDLEGHNIAWIPAESRPPVSESFASRDYFKKVVEIDRAVIEGPFVSKVLHAPVVVIAAPVHDKQRRIAGVALSAIDVTTSLPLRNLNRSITGDDEHFIVVSADGTVVAHPDTALVGKPLSSLGFAADAIGRALTLGESSARVSSPEGKRYVLSFQSVRGPRAPWLLVAIQSEASLFEPMEAEIRKGVLIAAAVLVAGSTILVGVIIFMLAPLRQVQERLRLLSQGPEVSEDKQTDDSSLEPEQLHAGISRLSAARDSAEQDTLTSRSLLQAALYSVRDGVIAVNTDGIVKTMNSAASSATGWRVRDAENRPLADVYAPFDTSTGERAPCPLDAVIARRVPHAREGLQVRGRLSGAMAVKETITPVLLPDGSVCGLVVTFRDPGREDATRRSAQMKGGIQGVEELGNALENVIELAMRQNIRSALVVVEMASGGDGRLSEDEIKSVWTALSEGSTDALRPGDLLYRWGERTALGVLPDVDLAEAALLSGHLLTSASATAQRLLTPPCSATFTHGVATFDRDVKTPAALVALAEETMAHARKFVGTSSIFPGSAGIGMVRELQELLKL